MKAKFSVLVVAMLALTAIFTSQGISKQTDGKKKAADTPDKVTAAGDGQEKMTPAQQETMKRMMEWGTPGSEHRKLDGIVGKWTAATRMWEDPKGPAQEAKATSELKWILDGRFITQEYTGDFMGQKFTGLGFYGYDIAKKKFIATWTDSMSTGIMQNYGTADASGKSITFFGECECPKTGKPTKMRSVLHIKSDKEWTWEMFGPDDAGKEFRCMEITYTKA